MGSLALFVVKAGGFLPGEPEKVTRTAFSKEKAGRVRAAGNVPREEHPTSRELKRIKNKLNNWSFHAKRLGFMVFSRENNLKSAFLSRRAGMPTVKAAGLFKVELRSLKAGFPVKDRWHREPPVLALSGY